MTRPAVFLSLLGIAFTAVPLYDAAGAAPASTPSLLEAAKSGDSATVLEQIAQHGDVNAAEADGTTALHWAVRSGDRKVVTALLKAGADASAANRYKITPLQLAAENGDAWMLQTLLAAGAAPNATLPEGETVLMTAARTGAPEPIRVLLAHGADIKARESWYGESALMWAVAENHADAARLLIEHGADVNERSSLETFPKRRSGQSILPLGNWTPMMYAARQNALAAAAPLIEAHAGLDLADPDGATALMIAIINANYEFAALLLSAGANPNVVDASGMGALYAAVDMHRLAIGHGRPNPLPTGSLTSVDIVRQLLERGADPQARLTKPIIQRQHTFGDTALGDGATPFMRASKSGDVEIMKLLLAAGVDPHAAMPDGATALMYAAGLGWRYGSPLAPSFDQGTDEEAVEAIKLLLGLGLDINAKSESGNTALHEAVGGRASETIIRFLVASGADLTATNKKGQTPADYAAARRHEPLAELLQTLAKDAPASAKDAG